MTEERAGDVFLASRLRGSSALVALLPGGIHADKAPDGTDAANGAYLVFSPGTTRDETANDRVRIFTEILYNVRSVFAGNGPEADEAADLIDSLLSNSDGGELKVQENGFQIDCMRMRPLAPLTMPMARTYRMAGGWYRVTVRRLT